MKKVFLGGTCNDSSWRERLIPMLKIGHFNPVVPDWTPECQAEEIRQRENCDFVLYVITPLMEGVYSIAEVIDDSNKRPEKTVFCVLGSDLAPNQEEKEHKFCMCFSDRQLKSLDAVGRMVERNGGVYLTSLEEVADYLNGK